MNLGGCTNLFAQVSNIGLEYNHYYIVHIYNSYLYLSLVQNFVHCKLQLHWWPWGQGHRLRMSIIKVLKIIFTWMHWWSQSILEVMFGTGVWIALTPLMTDVKVNDDFLCKSFTWNFLKICIIWIYIHLNVLVHILIGVWSWCKVSLSETDQWAWGQGHRLTTYMFKARFMLKVLKMYSLELLDWCSCNLYWCEIFQKIVQSVAPAPHPHSYPEVESQTSNFSCCGQVQILSGNRFCINNGPLLYLNTLYKYKHNFQRFIRVQVFIFCLFTSYSILYFYRSLNLFWC